MIAGVTALLSLSTSSSTANAQEIQLTGPLAGAPAVRKLRLHRAGRFEVSVGSSFSLLDQYLRTVMPGATLTYHFTDWIGVGVWGGYGFQYTTGLTDELQQKAIDDRNCAGRPSIKACQLTAVNVTRGKLSSDQLGHIQWTVAPQVVAVPFRGKISLFGAATIDTDVDLFAGAAIIGMRERQPCGADTDGVVAAGVLPCANAASFALASRVTVAPTFGLGLNFYPSSFFGLGFEFRALPFTWNTSGFDNHGGGNNKDFPDNNVNSADREFHFNTMISVQAKFAFPINIKSSQ
ncbi:Hypothetical protein A7982_03451 [Minicystis rosea]|nr:Hypothetical protein A7982_03451 [Minicystis rosea]